MRNARPISRVKGALKAFGAFPAAVQDEILDALTLAADGAMPATAKTFKDVEGLTTRDAEAATGVAHSEFSRIRQAQLRRFTLDRPMTILGKLDGDLEVRLVVRTRRGEARPA
ncbi:helix-turn-helix domain-containing protein [Methylobacterium currus]|uniref:XRE family transcriptional regulator n=1 Tax=Methylobacterium currus TaxID=2051553 RepID=UPI001E5B3CA3|nr:XRE family transcriptional regulator [Methylobacterium currus]UHC18575.1 helix-turn-helix domain-containing protein [Methylobacterium currus]